jgi:hypothetical protein
MGWENIMPVSVPQLHDDWLADDACEEHELHASYINGLAGFARGHLFRLLRMRMGLIADRRIFSPLLLS